MKKETEQNEQEQQKQEEAPSRPVSRASAAIAAIAVAGLAMPAVASELPQVENTAVEQAAQPTELSNEALDNLLKGADLKAGKSVRVIKTLEIRPGAVIAKQYDR
jgi:hypothetical protein